MVFSEFKRLLPASGLLASMLLFSACDQQSTMPTAAEVDRAQGQVENATSADPATQRIKDMVDRANAKFAAMGSPVRVGYPWMFRVGQGVDPFANLRTGYRWAKSNVTYMLDGSDFTDDVAKAQVETAMVSAYDSWNAVGNTYITANRVPDSGENVDIYDAVVRERKTRECVDLFDYSADSWVKDKRGNILGLEPAADIVVGGWIPTEYFSDCLGSESIIGVTWTFFGPDTNGDNYQDILFVEQYYNPAFAWTTRDAVYLDFEAPMDVESIAVHENGHALGLDHFGGPIVDQQWKLKGQDRVFDPEAVMNPYYIGGEKRTPYDTDVAGLRTLYTGHTSTTE